MENQAFRLAAGNTLRFFAVCIPILVVLSLLIAVLLTKRKRGMQLLKSMFLLPMAIPVASVVILWKVLFHDQGLLNHLLSFISVSGTDWMNTDASFGGIWGTISCSGRPGWDPFPARCMTRPG